MADNDAKTGDKVRIDPATSQATDIPASDPKKLVVDAGVNVQDAKDTALDPFGDTPAQMRDVHSPEVDPANADVDDEAKKNDVSK